ncbi:MAG: hypothetical protein JWM11_5237 [Planctomycetaceae bacterium]|nr:hypothetical protein [Planctomycetaceae bacterium]
MRFKNPRFWSIVLVIAPFVLLGYIGFVFVTSSPPLRPNSPWLSVATISQIPIDGQPVRLPIKMARYDAWTRLSDQVAGYVFARRDLATNEIHVVSSVHGRLLVPVNYDQISGVYISRCFGIRFGLDGMALKNQKANPSADDRMESFQVKIADSVLCVQNENTWD